VAHQERCATKCLNSLAHVILCVTEIVKPMNGAGRMWGPPYFCGTSVSGAL
jgi:hypothetical protein